MAIETPQTKDPRTAAVEAGVADRPSPIFIRGEEDAVDKFIQEPTGEFRRIKDVAELQSLAGEGRIEVNQTEQLLPPSAVMTSEGVRKQAEKDSQALDQSMERMRSPFAPEQKPAQAPETMPAMEGIDPELEGVAKMTQEALQAQMDSIDANLATTQRLADEESSALIQSLKDTYAKRRQRMEQINSNRLTGLSRSGAQRGVQRFAAESQHEMLSDEEIAAFDRIAEIDKEEAQMIAQAKRARDAGAVKALNDAMSAKSALAQEKFDMLLTLNDEARKNDKAALDRMKEARLGQESQFGQQLDLLGELRQIPAGQSITLDTPFGEQTFEGMKEVDPFFTSSNITQLMRELPDGESLSIEDPNTGEVYDIQGLGLSSPNTVVKQVTDNRGNVSFITIDKSTGQPVNQVVVPGAGKSSRSGGGGGGGTVTQRVANDLGTVSSLLQSNTGSDGYTNTEAYRTLREEFLVANPGKAKAFDDTFQHRLNPNDPTAHKFMSKAEIEIGRGSSGYTQQQKDSLLNFGVDEDTILSAETAGIPYSELIN